MIMKDSDENISKYKLPGYFKQIGEYNKILSCCISDMLPVILGDIKIIPNIFHLSHDLKAFQTKFHQHKFCELSFMMLGCMDYDFNGKKCHISDKDNSIVLIPDQLIHNRIASVTPAIIGGFMLDIVAINKDGEMLLPKIKSMIKKTNFYFTMPSQIYNLRECLLEELKTRSPFFNDKIELLLHNFLFEMFREYFSNPLWISGSSDNKLTAYERTTLVYIIKTFVEENLSSPFSVKDVAEYVHLCKRHLNRIFTDQTNIPLGKYIIYRKMEAAKKMLLTPDPDTKVKQVAYALGYKEVSYFCRIFKKNVGVTPSEYGKKIISIDSK